MPTKRPYTVSVKLTQHEKPTRRVPGPNTIVGNTAMTLVVAGESPDDYLQVQATKDPDGQDIATTQDGLALWLALGGYLEAHAENPKLKMLLEAILGVAHTLIKEPDTILLAAAAAEALRVGIEDAQDREMVEKARKTSTAGSN